MAAFVASDDEIDLPGSDRDVKTESARADGGDGLRSADFPVNAVEGAPDANDTLMGVFVAALFDIMNLNFSCHGRILVRWCDRQVFSC